MPLENSENKTSEGLLIGGRRPLLSNILPIPLPVSSQVKEIVEAPDLIQTSSRASAPIALLMMFRRMTRKISTVTGTQKTINDWVFSNTSSTALLQQAASAESLVRYLNPSEMQTQVAVGNSQLVELNNFLELHNRPVLPENIADTDIIVATIMNIALKWSQPGEDRTIVLQDSTKVAGFKIDLESNGAYYESSGPNAIRYICLNTTTPTRQVWVSPIDHPFVEEDPIKWVQFIEKQEKTKRHMTDAIIPDVDLNQQWDLSGLIGGILENHPTPYTIISMIANAQLKMDKNGATATANVIGKAALLGINDSITIDRPFIAWMRDTRCPEPLIAFIVGKDSMKVKKS